MQWQWSHTSRLQPHALVATFHAALLEQQIVVVCADAELRVATCELLLLLLHPLDWAQVYVPTIPDELLGLLVFWTLVIFWPA